MGRAGGRVRGGWVRSRWRRLPESGRRARDGPADGDFCVETVVCVEALMTGGGRRAITRELGSERLQARGDRRGVPLSGARRGGWNPAR